RTIGAITTAPRPARAPVDRRRCAGLSLSGSSSALAGIATLRNSSFRHSRRGALFEQLTADRTSDERAGTWGKYIHRLGNDFTDVAVIGSALRQSLSGTPARRPPEHLRAGERSREASDRCSCRYPH